MSGTFDPFTPGALKRAFTEAEPRDRAGVLYAALQGMAKGLRGIDTVVELQSIDESAFLAGLRQSVTDAPANLTAARALAWFYVRNSYFAEANRVYYATEKHWTEYGEIQLEHMRTLIVDGAFQEAGAVLNGCQRFLKGPARDSYTLQTGVAADNDAQDRLTQALLQAGAAELRTMLAAAGPGARAGVQPCEETALWRAAELILRAKTVALVGNSATVRGRSLGQDIDAHDVVIRCNFPEIAGYERDVGRRTDLVFFNESLRPRVPGIRQRMDGYAATLAIGLHPEAQFGLPTAEELRGHGDLGTIFPSTRSFLSSICYSRSTTGLMAINLLVLVFGKRVALFGFDFFSDLKTPHYFGNQSGAYLGHELQYEQWFVRSFLERRLPQQIEFRA